MNISIAEKDHLKVIFNITERNRGMAGTNDIAAALNTSAAAVTDMIQRLAKKNLLVYQKYKGVKLSSSGIALATQLIRRERLWKVFLNEKLHISWDEIGEIAEQLKQVESDSLIDRLENYLDYPKYDPLGEAIPNAEGKFTLRNQISLFHLNKGQKAIILAVRNNDASFLQFLDQCQLTIGTEIEILQEISFDFSKRIRVGNDISLVLSSKVCHDLYVKPLN